MRGEPEVAEAEVAAVLANEAQALPRLDLVVVVLLLQLVLLLLHNPSRALAPARTPTTASTPHLRRSTPLEAREDGSGTENLNRNCSTPNSSGLAVIDRVERRLIAGWFPRRAEIYQALNDGQWKYNKPENSLLQGENMKLFLFFSH